MVSRTISVSKSKVAKRKQPELIRNAPAYAMCIPSLLYFLLFSYIPMAGIVLVFKDYNVVDGIFGSPWTGPLVQQLSLFLFQFPRFEGHLQHADSQPFLSGHEFGLSNGAGDPVE